MEHWTSRLPLDEALRRWLNEANTVLMNGGKLAYRAEQQGVPTDAYSSLALLLYQRLAERQIDAELRDLLGGAQS